MVKCGGWRGAGAPGRPEPTTAIVRRGEDGWGRGAGRRLCLAALPSATTASAVVPASVAGPAKLDYYPAIGARGICGCKTGDLIGEG